MDNPMSIRQALDITRTLLKGIMIPVELIEQVGMPVATAVANLTACIESIDKAEQDEKAEVADDGDC